MRHLILIKMQNPMDINEDLLQCFIGFLLKKKLSSGTVINEIISN